MSEVDDLTRLPELSEASLLACLAARFGAGRPYTRCGATLVALNPYRDLGDGRPAALAPGPHVFRVARACARACLQRPQAVFCQGESGAGKSESCKRFLQCLGHEARDARLETRLGEASPVLEALGNAATLRNLNSSRVGKFVRCALARDGEDARLVGASVETYLLERSRVAKCGPGESNFHIFRQVAGPRAFKLLGPNPYEHGSWQETATGLRAFDIDPDHVRRIIEGILMLGEIEFAPDGDGAKPIDNGTLAQAATLLDVDATALSTCLMFAELDVRKGGTQLMKKLSLPRALEQRDALCRLIYAQLFDWVVSRINTSLSPGQRQVDTYISILDIFGFERFEENLLEQLLINYANEKLHHLFMDHTLRLEQERYKSEGIKCASVKYNDNQATLAALNQLFKSLEDATQLNRNFVPPTKKGHVTVAPHGESFVVTHMAGDVTYLNRNMVKSNTDTVDVGLLALCNSSTSVLAPLFAIKDGGVSGAGNRKQGITAKFTTSMQKLLTSVASSDLHFIKCIKPNTTKSTEFDMEVVRSQVIQHGILEVTKLRATGYEVHLPHAEFQVRYGLLHLDPAKEAGIVRGKTLFFMKSQKREELDERLERVAAVARKIQRSWRIHKQNERLKRRVAACLAIVKVTEAAREREREAARERERQAQLERERQAKLAKEKAEQESKERAAAAVAAAEEEKKKSKKKGQPPAIASDAGPASSPVMSSSHPPALVMPSPSPSTPKTTRRFSFRSTSSPATSAPGTPTMGRRGSVSAGSADFSELPPEARKLAKEMGLVEVSPADMPILTRVLDRMLNKNGTSGEQKYHFPEGATSTSHLQAASKQDVKARGKEVFRGKSAIVYASRDVATKVMKLDDESGQRELAVLQAFSSKPISNVATLLEARVTSKELWLQLKLVDAAAPLNAILNVVKVFESLQVSFLVRQILSGVAQLHNIGIVHRSISLHNVLVNSDGQVTLIDFGQASMVPNGGLEGMVGPPFFVSPEMVRGERHGCVSDVYSVGALAYNLITGHAPTLVKGQKSSKALGLRCMYLVGTGRVPLLESTKYNSSLIDFVTQCMNANQAQRPSAAQLLQHPFLQQQVLTLDLGKAVKTALKDKAINDFFKER